MIVLLAFAAHAEPSNSLRVLSGPGYARDAHVFIAEFGIEYERRFWGDSDHNGIGVRAVHMRDIFEWGWQGPNRGTSVEPYAVFDGPFGPRRNGFATGSVFLGVGSRFVPGEPVLGSGGLSGGLGWRLWHLEFGVHARLRIDREGRTWQSVASAGVHWPRPERRKGS